MIIEKEQLLTVINFVPRASEKLSKEPVNTYCYSVFTRIKL